MVGGSMAWLPSGKLSHNYNIMPGHENPLRITGPLRSLPPKRPVMCSVDVFFILA